MTMLSASTVTNLTKTELTKNDAISTVLEWRINEVFISYSHKDKAFAQTLDSSFRQIYQDPWVDWDDIKPGEDWWESVKAGIEAAGIFVFVISPSSVTSRVCRQEVEHAVLHNKRLVPILRQDGFSMEDMHPVVIKQNWIYFRETDKFDQGFQALVKAIDPDLDYVQAHT